MSLSFGSKIEKYRGEILRDLAALVAIPSVCGAAKGGLPYGEKSAEALARVLDMANSMGFSTKNVGNYAGHAEYGAGEELSAVLTHVDVVPAGAGWSTDPFEMVCRDGLAYGRGTADDKGAAIVALYCLKVLKEEKIAGKRRLRVIFGAGEEIGMDDLRHYFAAEPLPQMGFTPDAEYGICNREKGILHFNIMENGNSSRAVTEFHAGSVVNAVPDRAFARLVCGEPEYSALEVAAEKEPGRFALKRTPDGAEILSHGKAAHAMQPEKGLNAATHLLRLLFGVFDEAALGRFLSYLDRSIGTETDGFSMGVKQSDEPSGDLTFNLGLLDVTPEKSSAGVDIRYPVTADGDEIIRTLTGRVEQAGFGMEVTTHNPPLYLPENSPLISLLRNAYAAVTGKPAELYATGGGTYARAILGRGVAFGPFFPDEPDRGLHNANENIDIDRFLLHAQICLEAMYRMMTE